MFLEVFRGALAFPAFIVEILSRKESQIGLETRLQVEKYGGHIQVLYSRTNLKSFGTIV
jgi:hypothetical protein